MASVHGCGYQYFYPSPLPRHSSPTCSATMVVSQGFFLGCWRPSFFGLIWKSCNSRSVCFKHLNPTTIRPRVGCWRTCFMTARPEKRPSFLSFPGTMSGTLSAAAMRTRLSLSWKLYRTTRGTSPREGCLCYLPRSLPFHIITP